MVLLSNQTGRSHTGIGLAIFGTIGQLGPFLGTEGLYGEEDSPFYTKSTSISAGIAFFAGILAAATAFSLHLANRKRDRKNPIQDEGVEKKEEIRDRRVDGLDLRGAEDRFEFERRLTDVAREGKRSIYCELLCHSALEEVLSGWVEQRLTLNPFPFPAVRYVI